MPAVFILSKRTHPGTHPGTDKGTDSLVGTVLSAPLKNIKLKECENSALEWLTIVNKLTMCVWLHANPSCRLQSSQNVVFVDLW